MQHNPTDQATLKSMYLKKIQNTCCEHEDSSYNNIMEISYNQIKMFITSH